MAEVGLCRLTGHKGMITKLSFMTKHNIIISASTDMLVKFWDIDTQHNFRTLVGHRSKVKNFFNNSTCKDDSISVYFFRFSQVWGLALVKDDEYLITGCNDTELRVWKIFFVDIKSNDVESNLNNLSINEESEVNDMVITHNYNFPQRFHLIYNYL